MECKIIINGVIPSLTKPEIKKTERKVVNARVEPEEVGTKEVEPRRERSNIVRETSRPSKERVDVTRGKSRKSIKKSKRRSK